MKQEKGTEFPDTPHPPESEPIAPEFPTQRPDPGIPPQNDPEPSREPAELPPGQEKNVDL